jgi:hypothetical protein
LISCNTSGIEIPVDAIGSNITFITTGSAKTVKLQSVNKISDSVSELSVSEWDNNINKHNAETVVYVVFIDFPDLGVEVASDYTHIEGY